MSTEKKQDQDKGVVLITGCQGLLGSALCEALRDDYTVVGFDVKAGDECREGVDYVKVDLGDDKSVARGLDYVRRTYGPEIVSVLHLAAYYDFSGEPSDLYELITVRGTARLLHGLKEFNTRQFVFSSSMLVHAPAAPGKAIDETSSIQPKWDYPESKVRAERLIEEEHGEIPAVFLRIAGVYTDHCDSIPLSEQMRRIYESRLTGHVYPGDLSRGQAFVHLDDVVRAFTLAIERREKMNKIEVFLIGEPETLGYGDLQQSFGRLLHDDPEWLTEQIPKTVAKTGAWVQGKIPGIEEPFIKPWMIDLSDDHFELDIRKAELKLHWKPEHSLRRTLPKMAAALTGDPEAWYKRHGFNPGEVPAEMTR